MRPPRFERGASTDSATGAYLKHIRLSVRGEKLLLRLADPKVELMLRILATPLLVLSVMFCMQGYATAFPGDKLQQLRDSSSRLRSQQQQLKTIQSQRKSAIARLPQLKRQSREAQLIADKAEANYLRMSRQAGVSRHKLDLLTVKYIGSVQSLGSSSAMAASENPELEQLAGTASAEDAVLVYSQGQMMMNQMKDKLDSLRQMAAQAAERRKRAEAAHMSAEVARQQADASIERQRQLSALLSRTASSSRQALVAEQKQMAGLFNQLLGDPSLPGVDIDAMGLPAQQRIAMLALREWKKGVAEQPLGSNDSPDIARYRTATAGAVRGGAWCAYFVSYIVRRAGLPIGPGGSGTGWVPYIADWGRSNRRFFSADDKRYKPQAGDIIVWPAHTGIVISTSGSKMLTVEGNSSDRVMRQTRNISTAVGFVRVYGDALSGAKQSGNPSAGSPSGGIL